MSRHEPFDTPPQRPKPMWEIPRSYIVQRRTSALLEIFKFGLYCAFPLGCMIYFGGPYFYNKYVKPDVADYTLGIWKDSPNLNKRLPQSREELDEMIEEMRSRRRDEMLADLAGERTYDSTPTSPSTSSVPDSRVRRDTERLV